jgi:hypothetical protein
MLVLAVVTMTMADYRNSKTWKTKNCGGCCTISHYGMSECSNCGTQAPWKSPITGHEPDCQSRSK